MEHINIRRNASHGFSYGKCLNWYATERGWNANCTRCRTTSGSYNCISGCSTVGVHARISQCGYNNLRNATVLHPAVSRIISRKCGHNIDVILLMCCVSRRGDALGAIFQPQCFTSNSNVRKRLFTKRHRRTDVVSLLIPPSLYLRFIFKCIWSW